MATVSCVAYVADMPMVLSNDRSVIHTSTTSMTFIIV